MEVHKAIQEGLCLPTWYGNNVDALWDMVTGYIETPITICIFPPTSSNKGVLNEVKKCIVVFRRAIEQGYDIKLLNGLQSDFQL